MITTEDFIRKTLDPIEKLYAKEICPNVPNYIKFWDDFVGGKFDRQQGMIVHHEFIFPTNFHKQKAVSHNTKILKIFMSNFKIFTNLSGARYQLENLKKALNLKTGNKKRHFLHWESFEVAYIHLGNIKHNIKSIWDILKKLDRSLGNQDIRSYLTSKGKTITLKQFNRLYGDKGCIKVYRDNFVHFSRNFNLKLNENYYVPENLQNDLTWLEQPPLDTLVPTHVKFKEDLEEAEMLFNRIERVFYNILKNYVRSHHIKIRRSM